jgi:hypothetical protein
MVMKIITLLLVLLLSGCCTFCEKEVCPGPLVVQPKPPPNDAFVRPNLSISCIVASDDIGTKFEAYKMSIEELQDHVIYLEKLLSGYR